MNKTGFIPFLLLVATLFANNISAQPFGQYIHFDGIDDELTTSGDVLLF